MNDGDQTMPNILHNSFEPNDNFTVLSLDENGDKQSFDSLYESVQFEKQGLGRLGAVIVDPVCNRDEKLSQI